MANDLSKFGKKKWNLVVERNKDCKDITPVNKTISDTHFVRLPLLTPHLKSVVIKQLIMLTNFFWLNIWVGLPLNLTLKIKLKSSFVKAKFFLIKLCRKIRTMTVPGKLWKRVKCWKSSRRFRLRRDSSDWVASCYHLEAQTSSTYF